MSQENSFKLNHLEFKENSNMFILKFIRRSNRTFNDILKIINLEDYPFIYKSTNVQKKVSLDEFYKFKYAGYVFFKYSIDDFLIFLKESKLSINFFNSSDKFLYLIKNYKKINIKNRFSYE